MKIWVLLLLLVIIQAIEAAPMNQIKHQRRKRYKSPFEEECYDNIPDPEFRKLACDLVYEDDLCLAWDFRHYCAKTCSRCSWRYHPPFIYKYFGVPKPKSKGR